MFPQLIKIFTFYNNIIILCYRATFILADVRRTKIRNASTRATQRHASV